MKRLTSVLSILVIGVLVVSCAPKVVEETVVVEKVVKETVIVEKPVEKVVKETVVVEKPVEKVVTATPGQVTLTFWNHPCGFEPAKETQYFDDLNAAFEAEHPGVKVKLSWVPWDQMYVSKINAIHTGMVPDISFMGVEQAIEFAEMDAIIPLDDLVEEYGGPEAFTGKLTYHWYKPTWSNEGHYWGVPFQEGGYLLYVRKDLLKAAGYDDPCPKDWDELIEMAKAIHDPENGVYGIALDYSAGNGTQQLYQTFWAAGGGQILDKDKKVAVNTPENAKTLQFYTDLWLKYDLLPPGVSTSTMYGTSTATPIDDWYLDGQIGMVVRNMSNAVIWGRDKPPIWEKTQVCMMPNGPSGHTGTFSQPGVLYIFKGSNNQELAKEYIRFFYRPEWQVRYCEAQGFMPNLVSTPDVRGITDQYWYPYIAAEQEYGARAAWPETHPQALVAHESFWMARMVQDVVLKDMSVEDALAKYQKEAEELFQEPCSPLVEGCK